MSKENNQVDLTSGLRFHVQEPDDDRILFVNLQDVLDDLEPANGSRYISWYDGLLALNYDEHTIYVWRPSNDAHNISEGVILSNNVDYNAALMPTDLRYPISYPDVNLDANYAGLYYNWFPIGNFGSYFNNDPTSATNLEGWPEGTIPGTQTFQYMWDTLLYPYVPPAISLVGIPSPIYREKGDVIPAITLFAQTVKKKLDITSVLWYRNNVLSYTTPSANPQGTTETWNDVVPVGAGVNPQDVAYKATVSDGQSTVQSNIVNYRFVYPFYVGNNSSQVPDETTVKAMSKQIVPKQNINYEHDFSQSRYVIAYPQSYGSLVSILDKNGYETIDDYRINTDTYTMLDGNSVDYFIYVFEIPGYESNLTDAVDFDNTYKF